MQKFDRLVDVHVRKAVVLIVENQQRPIVRLGLVDEPTDLRLDVIAGVEMVGSPEQSSITGQYPAAGVVRIGVGLALGSLVDNPPNAG